MLTKVNKTKTKCSKFVRLALTVPFHFLVIAAIALIHQRFELKTLSPWLLQPFLLKDSVTKTIPANRSLGHFTFRLTLVQDVS